MPETDARPWIDHYEAGVSPELPAGCPTFHAIWEAAAAQAPGRPALVADSRTLRYADLEALVARATASMLRDGVTPGSRVLVALPPGVHWVVSALATWRAGAVLVPADPGSDAADLSALAIASRPALTIVTPGLARAVVHAVSSSGGTVVEARSLDAMPRLLRVLARAARPRRVGSRPPCVSWSNWLTRRAASDLPRVAAEDEAMVRILGAATAPTVFRHAELAAGALQLSTWLADAMPGAETWLVLMDLWSPAGLVTGLGAAFAHRSRLALLNPALGDDILDALRFLRPSYVFSSAADIVTLLGVRQLLGKDLRSVRSWIVTDPISSDLVRQFEEVSGLEPCQGAVLPRSAGFVTCSPLNAPRAPGSVGLPMPSVDVRITDSGGAKVPAGEIGWLNVRGPNVAPAGSWYAPKVAARMNEAGFVFLSAGSAARSRTPTRARA